MDVYSLGSSDLKKKRKKSLNVMSIDNQCKILFFDCLKKKHGTNKHKIKQILNNFKIT